MSTQQALEPFTYREDFESGELRAWASYPLWQDTAYDDNFRVNAIVPGDSNLSIEQLVTPYSPVDAYAGAQKKLDMFLVHDSSISLRYYLKTHLPVEFLKVRIAGSTGGKAECYDYTLLNPSTNQWITLSIPYADLVKQNHVLASCPALRVNGIAVLMKVSKADPAMPLYFGLDDVVIEGARAAQFRFAEPGMYKLPEWLPFIPDRHYRPGDSLVIRGTWPIDAHHVTLTIVSYPAGAHDISLQEALTYGVMKPLTTKKLTRNGNGWNLDGLQLSYPPGLYLGLISAFDRENRQLAGTLFTLSIAPSNMAGRHPRLWFDRVHLDRIAVKLRSDEFASIRGDIEKSARDWRTKQPLETMVYDFDQFPDEDWLVTRYSWSYDRIRSVGEAVRSNALAYALLDDTGAGSYAKEALITYARFPSWLHPWMKKRCRHFYLLMGDMAMDFALAYDLTYELMSDSERSLIRCAFMKYVIEAAHRGYVDANLVSSNTSNWIAAIMGGSLMCQAAIYQDVSETMTMEPFLTGAVLKEHALIRHVTGDDGGYGEGYGYYHYSSRSWSKSLPSLENVFGIDLSERLNGIYDELAWAGIIKDRLFFHFGDSSGDLQPMEAWAWLLDAYHDPLLGWMYHYLNGGNRTLVDLIYDTDEVPQQAPFGENPVRLFRDIGTTVFKSGWERDDFVFVMRTGPFYNHQHLDQGSFWLADHGTVLIGERYGSAYYDDPLYESHYTQPIAHSTILIDSNPQSQRTGDPLDFIDGFDDHAFVYHFLDGESAAFSSGDIGRLYRGRVKDMKRNVLYLKPRTLLMLDTVVPGEQDVDVTLLYQGRYLDEITTGEAMTTANRSTIRCDTATLFIHHLSPGGVIAEAKGMPHFLREYDQKPLRRNGYLALTARTAGAPLVIANLLTTGATEEADIVTKDTGGSISGSAGAVPFACTKQPGSRYQAGPFATDALALTWTDRSVFAALCTSITRDNTLLIESKEPITCEIVGERLRYCLADESWAAIGVKARPKSVTVNGENRTFIYEPEKKAIILTLPAGEGTVIVE